MRTNRGVALLFIAFVTFLTVTSCSSKSPVPTPDVTVKALPSFANDVQPIFKEFCVQCHGPQDARNGLRLDTYEGVMKGTQFGKVITPGDPAQSSLISLIKHESDPKIFMPFHKEQLTPNRIKNVENWIRYQAPNN